MRGHRRIIRAGGMQGAEAGSASIVTPKTIFGSSLELWLRADMGITLNGGNVSAWADQSGKGGRDYTQGTAANQPAYNASDINGKPSVQFDGVNDLLSSNLTTGIATPSGGYFMFAVMRNDVGTVLPVNGFDAKALWSDVGSYIALGFGSDKMCGYVWGPGNNVVTPADSTATWVQTYYRWDASSIYASWNKGAESSVIAAYGVISSTTQIGQNYNGSAIFTGRVAEFIAVSRNATAGEIARLQAYATARYGV